MASKKSNRLAQSQSFTELKNLSRALDYFQNFAARMGYGTPSLAESTQYILDRLSLNYWLMLTMYRNHWICRRIVDLPAEEMCKNWARLNCELPPDDIKRFDRAILRTQFPAQIEQAIKWARLYGGAGCLICIKGHEGRLEEPLELDDVQPASFLGVMPFDRWQGIVPTGPVCADFNRPQDFGLPEFYEVRGQETSKSFKVHASRVLRFTGPSVPIPELQAMSWWGISSLEVVFEEIRKRDNASWAMLQLLFRAQVLAQKNPQLASMLSGLGASSQAAQQFYRRMQAQNELLSNQSMMILGEDGELFTTQYSFSGLDGVYQQFQMDCAGAAEIPLTLLFGRTMTGIGQTNEADMRNFENRIAHNQNTDMKPQLMKVYPVICMSELGEVPDDLDLTFPSVRTLTEEEKGKLATDGSAPVIAAFNANIIGRKTALQELRQLSDRTEIFSNITEEMIDEAEEEPQMFGEEGLAGFGGEGGGPGAHAKPSPMRTLREEAGGAMDSEMPRPDAEGTEDDVKALMEHRSFGLVETKRGETPGSSFSVYERHGGNILVLVRFLDGKVRDATLTETSYETGKDPRAQTRKGFEGLFQFASMVGDAYPVKKKILWHGLDVHIENPAGSLRSGTDAGGRAWEVQLTHDYGFLKNTKGVDGDPVDVFVGDDAEAEYVYVAHTKKAPDFTEYDEDKCFLNFTSLDDAKRTFFANYNGAEHFESMESIPVGEFIDKVLATKRSPVRIAADWLRTLFQ